MADTPESRAEACRKQLQSLDYHAGDLAWDSILAAFGRAERAAALNPGKVWSAIRSALNNCRAQLREATDPDASYEVESARFDGVARFLTDAVVRKLKEQP